MARHKGLVWTLPDNLDSWDQVNAAILMDIRDELQMLNRVMQCRNVLRIPGILDSIAKNTFKPKRKKAPKVNA